MRFLSFFAKSPSYQRFNYTPRYYNPIKEKAKEQKLIAQHGAIVKDKNQQEKNYRFHIKGSFGKAAHKKAVNRSTQRSNTALIRLGVILTLILFLVAYLSWGSVVLYGFLLFVPIYIYLKFKQ